MTDFEFSSEGPELKYFILLCGFAELSPTLISAELSPLIGPTPLKDFFRMPIKLVKGANDKITQWKRTGGKL